MSERQSTDCLVSIIMPAYNAEKYIEEAIQSVISQTYENWELIVIDDGSVDSTPRLIKKIAETDDRISFYINENNMGVAKTRNRGFDIAKGDYVALLDSDDIWLPEKLEKQLALALETDAEIIYAAYIIIDAYGNTVKEYNVPEIITFDSLLKENCVGCSTVMMKKEVTDRYRFDGNYAHEDYVMWLQILKNSGRATGYTKPLVNYRFYFDSRSGNKLKAAKNRWIIYRKYLKLPLVKSVNCFIGYVLAGIKKYKL